MDFSMNTLKNLHYLIETQIFPFLKDFLRMKLKRHVQIRSIRDFALPINNIKIIYDSPIMGLFAEEYCGVYEIRDVVVHSNSGLLLADKRGFGRVLIEESSKDYTDYVIFKPHKTDTRKLFSFHKPNLKSYSFDKNVYLFFVRRNITNFMHFLRDDFCPLLLLIQSGYDDFMIIHSKNMAQNQLEYLEMLKTTFGIEYMEAPGETHFRITSPVILTQYPNKKYFSMLYMNDDLARRRLFVDQKQGVTVKDDADFFNEIDFVGRYLPKDWQKEDKDFIWGKYQNIKIFPSNTSTKAVEILVKAILPREILENPTDDIVYISRRDVHRNPNYNSRYIANENEIIERFPQIKVINLTGLSQRKIMEIAYNAKILIGMHGAGLANGYFMRKSKVLIEIHPRYFRYPKFEIHFKVMCEAKGLRYIGVISSPLKDGVSYIDIDKLAQAIELAEEELQERRRLIMDTYPR